MKIPFILLSSLALAACAGHPAPSAPTNAPSQLTVEVSPERGDLQTALRAEVARSKALGLVPFIEFHATWCKPCQHIDRWRDDPKMVDAFRGTYVVRLDLDRWRDHLDHEAYPVKAVPVFFPLDGDGRAVERSITSDAWGPDVPEEMAPHLKAFFRAEGVRSAP